MDGGDPFIAQSALDELSRRSDRDAAVVPELRRVIGAVLALRAGDAHHRAAAWGDLYRIDRGSTVERILTSAAPLERASLVALVPEFAANFDAQRGDERFVAAARRLAEQLRSDPAAKSQIWDGGASLLTRTHGLG